MKTALFGGLALAVLALGATGSASAATINRYEYQSAAGVCQGALPAFAGTLRARPLAIGNEGSSPAFVTCALLGDDQGRPTTETFIKVGNSGASEITINCTYVYGYGGGPAATTVARTATLSPGSSSFLRIDPADIDASFTTIKFAPQWSCSLPSGGLIYYVGRNYNEDIGT